MLKWVLIVSLFTGEESVMLKDIRSYDTCSKIGKHFLVVNYGMYQSFKCKPVIERKQSGS